MDGNPPIWQMVRKAMEGLGGKASHGDILEYVQQHWPSANVGSVAAHINVCTVNSISRVQYAQNKKPRVGNGHYDFLFKLDRGLYALYDPKRHGIWEIWIGPNGKPKVGMVQKGQITVSPSPTRPPVQEDPAREDAKTDPAFLFPLERHLRDFLAANIRSVLVRGSTPTVYADASGQSGVEYPTPVGPIDLLATGSAGNFFVFELKLGRGPDTAVGQLARYMGWVREHLAGNREVTGVIVAKTVDKKLRYAASVIPNTVLFEYAMSFALHPAGEVSG